MTIKTFSPILSLAACALAAMVPLPVLAAEAAARAAITKDLTFYASFDHGVDADFALGDAHLFTVVATKPERKTEPGLHTAGATRLASGKGRRGNALEFTKREASWIFFDGFRNVDYRARDWSGTVSLWLKLDPETDLDPGFADPLQLTTRAWNDGSFFVDFNKDGDPRDFRLGAFSDLFLESREQGDPGEPMADAQGAQSALRQRRVDSRGVYVAKLQHPGRGSGGHSLYEREKARNDWWSDSDLHLETRGTDFPLPRAELHRVDGRGCLLWSRSFGRRSDGTAWIEGIRSDRPMNSMRSKFNGGATAAVLVLMGWFAGCATLPTQAPSVFLEPVPVRVLDAGAGEGPAWHPLHGLFFSGGGDITRLDPRGQVSVYRKDAGSNGLLFDHSQRLLVCDNVRRRITRTDLDGSITVLAENYGGHRFNQPNDITIDSAGRIYFSDPKYGDREGMEILDAAGKPIEGVYRIDPDGSVAMVIEHQVDRPNGVMVSGDDRYLFVADNNNNIERGARKLWRFDLLGDGGVDFASKRLIFDWETSRGPDGMAQDQLGQI
jgi:sugar lactone lactonase YvrE